MPTAAALIALLLCAVLETPPASHVAPSPVVAPARIRTLQPPRPRIEIIETGAEPRRVLRQAPAAGHVEAVDLEVEPLLNRFVDGDLVVNEKPVTTRLRLEIAVGDPSPDGSSRLRVTVSDAATVPSAANDAAQLAAVGAALDAIRGGTIEVDLDPRGAVVEMRVGGERWADDARSATIQRLLAAIARLFTPVPDEPLGVGARWRVLFDDMKAPIARREMLVLRIDRLDDATAECERYAIWSALRELQRVPEEMVPRAPDSVLTHLSGRGGGRVTIDRGRVAASALEDQSFVKLFAEGRDPKDNALRQLHEQTMEKTRARTAPPK